MAKIGTCEECFQYGRLTPHHKIFKSEQIALRDCKENIIYLCDSCHYSIHHGTNGYGLRIKLQLDFQNYLERILLKEYFTVEEIEKLLEIKYKDAYKIVKTLKRHKGNLYKREDIIREAMGGKIITESESDINE
ncbi:hypothetical protein [Clostridium beijerinckii]|uniref:hypothetical protein n=1 Tax=Clostridium beijerinckii TaxID=1520 RepID=UPI00047C3D2D|nr:hypothetical protein [Clostridium beijerinckii]